MTSILILFPICFFAGFRWHETRRNVRIELSADKLEAKGSSGSQWATFAGTGCVHVV